MSWKRLKPLMGRQNPCLNCPPIAPKLELGRRIAVGFGYAALECDGRPVWVESDEGYASCWTVKKAERHAAKAPNHDWRIVLHGPMHGETYQRQGKGSWVLVEKNSGFA